MATLAENAAAVKAAQVAIDAAIVSKGGTTTGGLANAAAAIAALPSGGGPYVPKPWYGSGTHVWLHFDADSPTHTQVFSPKFSGTALLDWGDGTAETITNQSVFRTTRTHEYDDGDYVLSLTGYDYFGFYNEAINLFKTAVDRDGAKVSSLVQFETDAEDFHGNGNDAYAAVHNAKNLKAIRLTSCVRLGNSFLNNLLGLESLEIIPKTGADFVWTNNGLECCISLKHFATPAGCNVIPGNVFNNCLSLESLAIDDAVEEIGTCFNGCYSLKEVVIPQGVTSIANMFLRFSLSLKKIVMKPTVPPTLGGTAAFYNYPTDMVIVVPYSADHSILDAYKTAPNWSTFASLMVEEEVA